MEAASFCGVAQRGAAKDKADSAAAPERSGGGGTPEK